MSIKKRGEQKYVARLRVDGQGKQRTFQRRSEAVEWEAKIRREVAEGKYVDPSAGLVLFKDYAETWLEISSLALRASTIEGHRTSLDRHLIPAFGGKQLSAIRKSDCQAVVSKLVAAGRKPGTIKKHVQVMLSIFDQAVEDGLIVKNTAKGLKRPKPLPASITPLTAEQVAEIAESIDPSLRAFVVLGAASGLRQGEMRALTISDFSPAIHLASDVAPARVTIRVRKGMDRRGVVGEPKSPKAKRDIPVPGEVAQAMIEHLREFGVGPDGLVFHRNDRPWPTSSLSERWRAASDTMGLARPNGPHALRHFHASTLLSAGVNIAAVSRRLGHSNVNVTLGTYSHQMPQDDERILEALRSTG